MSHLPSELRSLRRKARKRLQRIKRNDEGRTKREIWADRITPRERVALQVAGMSPDRFWDVCRDGGSGSMSVRGSAAQFESAVQARLAEQHGQLNLFEAAGVSPAPSPADAIRERLQRKDLRPVTVSELKAHNFALSTVNPGANTAGDHHHEGYAHLPFSTLEEGLAVASAIGRKATNKSGLNPRHVEGSHTAAIPAKLIKRCEDVDLLEKATRMIKKALAPRGQRDKQQGLLTAIDRLHNRKQALTPGPAVDVDTSDRAPQQHERHRNVHTTRTEQRLHE